MAGIYIHIPFCKQACHYCDFHFSTSIKKKDEMLNALKRELYLRRDELNSELIETIYFGGGTPSILKTSELESLIEEVYQHYEVGETPEITIEANPDDFYSYSIDKKLSPRAPRLPKTCSADRQSRGHLVDFQDLKKIGVNRLSIGVQSFFDSDLKLMN
ncbi:MAG: radical SAM protein, partial [Bacteroidota bacterium]